MTTRRKPKACECVTKADIATFFSTTVPLAIFIGLAAALGVIGSVTTTDWFLTPKKVPEEQLYFIDGSGPDVYWDGHFSAADTHPPSFRHSK